MASPKQPLLPMGRAPKSAPACSSPGALPLLRQPESLHSLLKDAWQIFRRHTRVLESVSFPATLLRLLSTLFLFTSARRPKGQQTVRSLLNPSELVFATAVHHEVLTRGTRFSSWRTDFAALSPLGFLIATGAHGVLVAAVLMIVVGDRLGERASGREVWRFAGGRVWKLVATGCAKFVVMMTVVFALTGAVLLAAGWLTYSSASSAPPIVAVHLLYFVLVFPLLSLLLVNLSFAELAASFGDRWVWGFAALKRSWELTQGRRLDIVQVLTLGVTTGFVLNLPLQDLVMHRPHEGSPRDSWRLQITAVAAFAGCVPSAYVQAYLQIVWVLLYLSCRERVESDFGLGAFRGHFDVEGTPGALYPPISFSASLKVDA